MPWLRPGERCCLRFLPPWFNPWPDQRRLTKTFTSVWNPNPWLLFGPWTIPGFRLVDSLGVFTARWEAPSFLLNSCKLSKLCLPRKRAAGITFFYDAIAASVGHIGWKSSMLLQMSPHFLIYLQRPCGSLTYLDTTWLAVDPTVVCCTCRRSVCIEKGFQNIMLSTVKWFFSPIFKLLFKTVVETKSSQ